MIDPRTVLLAIPAHDGRVECGLAGALMALGSAHMAGNVAFLTECSDVGLARNLLANRFYRESPFEWMVFIDSDISFSPEDFRILMNYPERDANGVAAEPDDVSFEAEAEGVTVNSYGEALLVTAEYARKVPEPTTVSFGLGFTRIHKGVFQKLEEAVDAEGTPRVGQFTHKGELFSHFFPAGPGFAGQWFGEDLGFFHLCRLCGITPRVEKRTRLLHTGRKVYPYEPR
jgi:hypothetical protein